MTGPVSEFLSRSLPSPNFDWLEFKKVIAYFAGLSDEEQATEIARLEDGSIAFECPPQILRSLKQIGQMTPAAKVTFSSKQLRECRDYRLSQLRALAEDRPRPLLHYCREGERWLEEGETCSVCGWLAVCESKSAAVELFQLTTALDYLAAGWTYLATQTNAQAESDLYDIHARTLQYLLDEIASLPTDASDEIVEATALQAGRAAYKSLTESIKAKVST